MVCENGYVLSVLSKPRMGKWLAEEYFISVDHHPRLVISNIYPNTTYTMLILCHVPF